MNLDLTFASDDEVAILELAREIAVKTLAPVAAEFEAAGEFPRDVFRILGRSGLLSLPFPCVQGGGGQTFHLYVRVLEVIASAWASVAVGTSVHSLACFPIATFGSPDQQARLPNLLEGNLLGAYCLSESQAGSDPAAIATTAVPLPEGGFRLCGTKAWVTHGGEADFYNVFARLTTDDKIACFFVGSGTPGVSFDSPERKMGLTGSTTAAMRLEDVEVADDALIGGPGNGLRVAFAALDSGRLEIAACAVGLATAAATAYAKERHQFGRRIIDHQGVGFLLADMYVAVHSARTALHHAARLRDAGLPYSREASAAKLAATDAAMKVTTDAVQVLGGYGYTKDFPLERYMREAKIMQIFEGTNQIHRLVISRSLSAR